ncbi:RPS6KA5 family protein [Megaselia abdita]
MKLMQPSEKAATECWMLKNISHPNIVSWIGAGWWKGRVFVCLERLDGGDLFNAINELDSNEYRFQIMKQTLAPLEYLHSKKIVHLDVKPENYVFTDDSKRKLKLIDFNLSEFCEEPHQVTYRVGTPGFMAPELNSTDGKNWLSSAADMCSLVKLYIDLWMHTEMEDEILNEDFMRFHHSGLPSTIIQAVNDCLTIIPGCRITARRLADILCQTFLTEDRNESSDDEILVEPPPAHITPSPLKTSVPQTSVMVIEISSESEDEEMTSYIPPSVPMNNLKDPSIIVLSDVEDVLYSAIRSYEQLEGSQHYCSVGC